MGKGVIDVAPQGRGIRSDRSPAGGGVSMTVGMRIPLLIVILVAMVALGCSSTAPKTAGEPGEPARGGTLVMALSGDPGHLNPAITTMGVTHEAADPVFNGLVAMDENLKAMPELAASWTVEQNGAVYRFTLDSGVRWHDGTPFTSAVVKFTFEELLFRFHGRARPSIRANLDSIDTPDDRTVVFRFKQPYAPFLRQLDVTGAPILPRHLYAGTDAEKNPVNMRPIGTGPFRFVSFEQGEINLVRNTEYFKPSRPSSTRSSCGSSPTLAPAFWPWKTVRSIGSTSVKDSARTTAGCVPRPTSGCWLVPGPRVGPLRDDGELLRQQLGVVEIEVELRPLDPTAFPGPVFRDRNFDTN